MQTQLKPYGVKVKRVKDKAAGDLKLDPPPN
jgi:hypothetical protein